MTTVISVENLSKAYHLGQISTGTFSNDLKVWWARTIGNPNPLLKIGQSDHGNQIGENLWALKDVSFTVEQGEALGIIGRNGAGKSTILKILSRVTAPTSGIIKVKGRIASLLEVGTGFHPELTGRENVYLNGAIMGMKHDEISNKFDEIVDFSGVEKFIDTPVKRYSSGMYVRLAFAVAAHLDPEILIVDEVLAVGDTEFQKKCLGKLSDVAGQGRTVLFVSHNLFSLRNLCNKGILLYQGEILNVGTISNVVDNYLTTIQNNFELQEGGFYDLSIRENLKNSELIVSSLKLMNSKGIASSKFPMGSSLIVSIKLENFYSPIHRAIGIIIKNSSDQWITSFTSGMKCEYKDEHRSNKEEALFHIKKLTLAPGDYYIDVSITQDGFGRVDFVERAAKFTIVEYDIYGTGFNFHSHFGYTYLDAYLEIKND